MLRIALLCLCALTASARASTILSVSRAPVTADVVHYTYDVRVGDTANAHLRIHRIVRERAPWVPRKTDRAVMLLHGDFATFATNFALTADGLAPWLAGQNIDAWGVDRRFTNAPFSGEDTSDFDAMSLSQELDDMQVALAFARAIRLVTDQSTARFKLVGFSRGGELAYFYAAREGALPAALRQVDGLVPLDVYVSLSPADEDFRQMFCTSAFYEYDALNQGVVDSDNKFQIKVGSLAQSAPAAQTPFQQFFPGYTNRDVLLAFMGQTYFFFAPSPVYHLLGAVLEDGAPVGLRFSGEDTAAAWLANAPAHSSLREAADTDAMTCGDTPPLNLPLSNIRVPLFLIGAAGGYGERAIYSTTQVSSTDVHTTIIRRLPAAQEAEDFGHGDLLYAPDAVTLAWQPLLAWVRGH